MNGIFCLENDWWDVKGKTSVEPMLELLQRSMKVPYIYRSIGTRGEFEYYLDKWTRKSLSRHPILYLGFHGSRGTYSGCSRPASADRVGRSHHRFGEKR